MKPFLFLSLISVLLVMPAHADERQSMSDDVKELEALIEGAKSSQKARGVAAQPVQKDFYRSLGKNMSIRGDGQFFYIQAGPTSIIIDKKGRVQIKAAENLMLQSKRSILIQAQENIHMEAGGEITQSKSKRVGFESIGETYSGPRPATQWFDRGKKETVIREETLQKREVQGEVLKSEDIIDEEAATDEDLSFEERAKLLRESETKSKPESSDKK